MVANIYVAKKEKKINTLAAFFDLNMNINILAEVSYIYDVKR